MGLLVEGKFMPFFLAQFGHSSSLSLFLTGSGSSVLQNLLSVGSLSSLPKDLFVLLQLY
jgi:hypothetical protein